MDYLLQRGTNHEINGIKFKVLDKRIKGVELEIEIEIAENSKLGIEHRGFAMAKLYGPNKKKENTVTITKNKESDIEFVKILALKIIKPLIDNFLSIEEKEDCNDESKKLFSCEICEKSFVTETGMKGHVTKMHKVKSGNQKQIIANLTEGEVSENEEVNTILNNIKEDKKYSSKCNQCETHYEAERKYDLIQNILKHKEECKVKTNKCSKCEYEAKSDLSLKRHLRDSHDVLSLSTSPPPKKHKISKVENTNILVEDMEIEIDRSDMEFDEVENDEFEFVNIDMCIDTPENLSRLKDEKIKAKAKKIEEEEFVFKEKQKKKDLEKKMIEETKKQNMKQKKQKSKDERKRMNKKNSIKSTKENLTNAIPNIRPVPENISHLVKKGDKIYSVPGDGACGPNSASAFLFKDEVFGPKLRKNMNRFFARHWEKRYKYLTQCSENHPFVRKIGGGGHVSFTDPLKLIRYLETSEEAMYLWTHSEDFAIISDMYQVKIKIISVNGEDDNNPTVSWIFPDKDMKTFAELKSVEFDEMVLLHQNNSHFDLIVSENDELATVGSLSFRSNIGPLINCEETEEEKEKIEEERDKDFEKEIKALKTQISMEKERNKYLETEFTLCKEELKRKTEENEKIKIELKDLREISKLGKSYQLNDVHMETIRENSCNYVRKKKSELKTHKVEKHTTKEAIKCQFCSEICESTERLNLHIKLQHSKNSVERELEFNCNDCSFQATEQKHLRNHFMLVHTLEKNFNCSRCEFKGITSSEISRHIELIHEGKSVSGTHIQKEHQAQDSFRCRACGEDFRFKGKLMDHRKIEHPKTVACCRKYMKNECLFSDVKCWWIHDAKLESEKRGEIFKCYICGDTFGQKGQMMVHKKSKHEELTKYCNLFLDEKCRFKDETCWYRHKDKQKDNSKENTVKNVTENSVFQEVHENLKPPIKI